MVLLASVALAAATLTGNTAAGTEETPEIADPTGDVHPLAIAAQLPADAALVQHADLYDLSKVYIAAEGEDYFFVRFVVADLPDSWILPSGPGVGNPIASIDLAGNEVVWDDGLLNSKVNLTAFFKVNDKNFRVVATLAELNLDNPNQFPSLQSRSLMTKAFDSARAQIQQQKKAVEASIIPAVGDLDPKKTLLSQLLTARQNVDDAHETLNSSAPWAITTTAKASLDGHVQGARNAVVLAQATGATYLPGGTVRQDFDAHMKTVDETLGEAQVVSNGLPDASPKAVIGAALDAANAEVDAQASAVESLVMPVIGGADAKNTILAQLTTADQKIAEAHQALNSPTIPWYRAPAAKAQLDAAITQARSAIAQARAAGQDNLPAGTVRDHFLAQTQAIDSTLGDARAVVEGLPDASTRDAVDSTLNAVRSELRTQGGAVGALVLPAVGGIDPKATLLSHLAMANQKTNEAHEAFNASLPWQVTDTTKGTIDGLLEEARDAINAADAEAAKVLPAGTVRTTFLGQMDEVDAALAKAQADVAELPEVTVSGSDESPSATVHEPRVLLFHRFVLIDQQGAVHSLDGLVDVETDAVQLRIAKEDVGSPARGDSLSRFRASSTFRSTLAMDFAPDATNAGPGDDPTSLVIDATSGQLVKPTFGTDYQFILDAPEPEPEPEPTDEPVPELGAGRLEMEALGATTQHIQAGGVATYRFVLRNAGDAQIHGLLSLSSPADGWTHSLSRSEWMLEPGAETTVDLSVSAIEGGAVALTTYATASESGGEGRTLAFTTTLNPIDSQNGVPIGGGVTDTTQGPADQGSADTGKKSKRTPGPGMALLLVAVLGLGAAIRRRWA